MGMPRWAALVARRVARLATALVLAVIPALLVASTAWAQMPPNPAPDATAPGNGLLARILGWLKYYGLWASIAALLLGGAGVAIGHFGTNYGASSVGRKFLLGGAIGAVIVALAWPTANLLYNSTS